VGRRWEGEVSKGEVGKREKLWGKEEVEKTKNFGQGKVFLVHPQNGLNIFILNWCISGCWFIPAEITTFSLTFEQPN